MSAIFKAWAANIERATQGKVRLLAQFDDVHSWDMRGLIALQSLMNVFAGRRGSKPTRGHNHDARQ
jgi:hypothetical protein